MCCTLNRQVNRPGSKVAMNFFLFVVFWVQSATYTAEVGAIHKKKVWTSVPGIYIGDC